MVLTGETFTADEAGKLGIVTCVIPIEELSCQLTRYLSRFSNLSAATLRPAKQALLAGADLGFTHALEPINRPYLGELLATADAVDLMLFPSACAALLAG